MNHIEFTRPEGIPTNVLYQSSVNEDITPPQAVRELPILEGFQPNFD